MTDAEVVAETLEHCAELGIDPVNAMYRQFFNSSAAADALMGHSDGQMRGRMAAQTFELLLDDSLSGDGGYLRWEVDNHVGAYGVTPDLYVPFFEAVRDSIRAALTNQWTDAYEHAWNQRIAALVDDIQAHIGART